MGYYNPYNQPNNIQYGYRPVQTYNTPQYYQGYNPYYRPVDPNFEQKKIDKKNLWRMGFAFGLAIILYVVLSNVIVLSIWSLEASVPAIGAILNTDAGEYALNGLLSVFVLGLPFLIAYFILKSKKIIIKLPYGNVKNSRISAGLTMALAPTVLISTIIINVISLVIQTVLGLSFSSGLEDLSVDGPLGAISLIISIAVLPAIIEEFCIRGVVLQPLRKYGDGFAIFTSAFIFSILHGNMEQIPYTLLAGIYFGYVCVITESLWPSMILHFINNSFSAIQLIVISYKGEKIGTLSTMIMLGILVVIGIIGAIIFFTTKDKPKLNKAKTYLKNSAKFGAVIKNPAMIVALVLMFITTLLSITTAS